MVNEWRFYVIFRISGDFGEFYNCLTIYYWYWLKDILMVCRSDCRSGLLNCVGILYNFEMVGEGDFGGVDFWWKV